MFKFPLAGEGSASYGSSSSLTLTHRATYTHKDNTAKFTLSARKGRLGVNVHTMYIVLRVNITCGRVPRMRRRSPRNLMERCPPLRDGLYSFSVFSWSVHKAAIEPLSPRLLMAHFAPST